MVSGPVGFALTNSTNTLCPFPILDFPKFKSSRILLIISGVLLGLLIAIRPQAIALILFFFIFFYKIYVSKYQLIIFSLTSLLTYIIFAQFITGDFLYWPSLGAFNLYSSSRMRDISYSKIFFVTIFLYNFNYFFVVRHN